jgi:DNA-binding transcriptional ArsR family regulator
MPASPAVEARRQKILSFLESTGNCCTSEDVWTEVFPAAEYYEEWCPVLRRVVNNFAACEGYGRRVVSHTHAEVITKQSDVSQASVYGYLRELAKRGLVQIIKVDRTNYYRAVNSPKTQAQRAAEIALLERLYQL